MRASIDRPLSAAGLVSVFSPSRRRDRGPTSLLKTQQAQAHCRASEPMRTHAAIARAPLLPLLLLVLACCSSSSWAFNLRPHLAAAPPKQQQQSLVNQVAKAAAGPLRTRMAAAGGAWIHASVAETRAAELRTELTDGLVVAAKVWGPVDGVPVLGLHGWLDNAATFDRMGPHLAAAGIRLVSIDFPGHGMSTHRSLDAAYHFTDYVYYALAVSRKLGWKKFSILGHSLGAAIGIALAGSYPEIVQRVVTVEALGLVSRPAETAPQVLRESIRQRAALVELLSRMKPGTSPAASGKIYPSMDAAVEARLQTVAKWPGTQTLEEESARILVRRGAGPADAPYSREIPPEEHAHAIPIRFRHDQRLAASAPVYLTEEQAVSFLAATQCPVLLFRGDNGWPADSPEEEQRRVAAFEGRLTVREVPGSHHLHLDQATCTLDGVIEPTIAFLLEEAATTESASASAAGTSGGGKL